MSLSARLATEAPGRKPSFNEWVAALPSVEREALEALAHPDSGYSHAQLLRWIEEEGGPGSAKESLMKYRESLR